MERQSMRVGRLANVVGTVASLSEKAATAQCA